MENNISYKWKKIFASINHNKRQIILSPEEAQELIDDIETLITPIDVHLFLGAGFIVANKIASEKLPEKEAKKKYFKWVFKLFKDKNIKL